MNLVEYEQGPHPLLKLTENPLIFEISNLTNVFFDKDNQHIFCVRSNGVGGVVVKAPDMETQTFFIEDKGKILSIRFSPNMKVLGMRREENRIDFLNFKQNSQVDAHGEYCQYFKMKSSKWQDFYWINSHELLFVNDLCFEHYQIIPEKRSFKLLKSVTLQINWLIWSRGMQLFVASTSNDGSVLNPFVYFKTQFQKLPKFKVDLPLNTLHTSSLNNTIYFLHENDVIIDCVYNEYYVMIIKQISTNQTRHYSEIAMYKLQPDSPAKKTYVLRLNLTGFVLSIVENLIVVHHQNTRSSLIYDIKLLGEYDGYVTKIDAIIKNAKLSVLPIDASLLTSIDNPNQKIIPEIYSKHWVMFLPNIIIDTKLGCYWFLTLELSTLDALVELADDSLRQIDFLLNRKNSKELVLKICHDSIYTHSNLKQIEKLFDKINSFYKSTQIKLAQSLLCISSVGPTLTNPIQKEINDIKTTPHYPLIEQQDLYSQILYPLIENDHWWSTHSKYHLAVLIEYFRSLNSHSISIEHQLYKLLFDTLTKSNKLYQLHQYLQYHVLTDSKPLACLLLSLQSTYPAAYQLGLDMLKRLDTENKEIIEVLLSKGHVLSAIRYAQSVGLQDFLVAKKFLDVAKDLNDSQVFYAVYKYFEERNVRERGTPLFRQEDNCDAYSRHFIDLFF